MIFPFFRVLIELYDTNIVEVSDVRHPARSHFVMGHFR